MLKLAAELVAFSINRIGRGEEVDVAHLLNAAIYLIDLERRRQEIGHKQC